LILLVSACSDEQSRCVSHSEQLNRKCSTVSVACPQAHWSDLTIPILCRYPLSCAMPVRTCASTLASVRPKVSYRVRVCSPSNAMSIFFRCFPTPSGKILCFCLFDLAMLMTVDFALQNCFCGNLPASLALRAVWW
jgi:hypothetical protein